MMSHSHSFGNLAFSTYLFCTDSMTRLLDYLFNNWAFYTENIVKKHIKFA